MKSADVRKKYIEFFKARGHAEIPSAPLVPENDPTTLFISAGMQPLITNILGAPHPAGKRLVDAIAVKPGAFGVSLDLKALLLRPK